MAVLTTLFLHWTFSRWILFRVSVVASFWWNTEVQIWLLDYCTLDRGFFFLENNLRHVILLCILLLLLLLNEQLLLLPASCCSQFFEASLHLLQHLGSVAYHQLDAVLGRLQELHCLLVVLPFNAHSINWEQLVAPFEPSVPFCHSSRNYAGNVNGWILFLSSHHVKSQAFICLWQLNHSRVWMAFACSKSSNCCLGSSTGSRLWAATDV